MDFGHAGSVKSTLGSQRFGIVRVSLAVMGLMVGATGVRGAHYARGEVIPEVKLQDGTVLRNVKVVAVGSTTIVARWAGGQGTIGLDHLPPEMREALAPAVVINPMAAPHPAPTGAAVLALAELPTEIKLTNGFVMHRAVVTHWEEHAVQVSYVGGNVTVQFKNIAPGERAIFEARKSEALAGQTKTDADQAAAKRVAARAELAQQAKEGVIPEVKLEDGRVLHNFMVTSANVWVIGARWEGGEGAILRTQLPPELREALDPAAPKPGAIEPAQAIAAELPTAIKLTNGFVMQQSIVMRWNGGSVLVRYLGGTVPVQFKNMVPEQRTVFMARESGALAEQAKKDVEQASANSTAAVADQKARAVAMWAAGQLEVHPEPPPGMRRPRVRGPTNEPLPWDDPDPEAIRQAISNHQLVKGMTKDEVRQSIGIPQLGYEKTSSTFIYLDRGRDKYGNHVERTLSFTQNDILMEWFDKRDGAPMSEAIRY